MDKLKEKVTQTKILILDKINAALMRQNNFE